MRGQVREDVTFVNNFWGRHDSGFKVIQQKINDSLSTLHELLNYYNERIMLEKEYTKKLEKLNLRTTIGSHETGTFKKSLDKLSEENSQMTKYNQKFIKSLSQINYEKLEAFTGSYHKRASRMDSHMLKVLSKRKDALRDIEQTKSKFQEDCRQLKALKLLIQTTLGKELERNEAKYKKVTLSIVNSRKNYQIALALYKEINEIFIRDWSITLRDFYTLELERIQICKVNCFNFCNNIATLCVDNDQSVDAARSVFAQIQPPLDLQDFSATYGTGDKIFKDPEYVDYLNGFEEKGEGYDLAEFDMPDHETILRRTYSTYSQASASVHNSSPVKPSNSPVKTSNSPVRTSNPSGYSSHPNIPAASKSPQHSQPHLSQPHLSQPLHDKELPPVVLSPPTPNPPQTPSPTRKAPTTIMPLTHDTLKPKESSVYSSSPEDRADVFSNKFTNSNGSNYSDPSTGSHYSTNSKGERHWASPRRREKQLHQFQEQINLKSKELPMTMPKLDQTQKEVPIMKDFSIDFIAKALEDLNLGGNGDISQYRKSVREAKAQEVMSNHVSASDYVDDREEVATRYESINFSSPSNREHPYSIDRGSKDSETTFNGLDKGLAKDLGRGYSAKSLGQSIRSDSRGHPKARPKSMLDPIPRESDSLQTCIVKDRSRRTLLSLPSKSYTNLHSMIDQDQTSVTHRKFIVKAIARYTYKPQQHGELFFKKGWQLYIIHKQEDNWFFCELGANADDRAGMVGLVPGNYLVEGNHLF